MEEEKIEFFFEDTSTFELDVNKIAVWIDTVSISEEHTIEHVSIIVCSDDYLLRMNKDHLDHDYYTDIITFDLSDNDTTIDGELYISIDRVRDNAHSLETPVDQELHRVIIHGVLHLIGYNDKTDQQRKLMRSKEDASLSLLSEI